MFLRKSELQNCFGFNAKPSFIRLLFNFYETVVFFDILFLTNLKNDATLKT